VSQYQFHLLNNQSFVSVAGQSNVALRGRDWSGIPPLRRWIFLLAGSG
jgi:hypothetical protein